MTLQYNSVSFCNIPRVECGLALLCCFRDFPSNLNAFVRSAFISPYCAQIFYFNTAKLIANKLTAKTKKKYIFTDTQTQGVKIRHNLKKQ
jgi:hypothetical protein